jgi:hypothetical protein
LIDEITAFSVNKNTQQLIESADGEIEPKYISLQQQMPELSFTTLALAKALAAVGISGLAIPGGANPAVFFFQKMLEDGGRAGTLQHMKGEVEQGLIVPRTLDVSQGGNATLRYDVIIRHDGSNEPIVFTASQTLTGSPSFSELFTLGPWVINNVELPGMIGATVDFGLDVFRQFTGGEVWPTFLSLRQRANTQITGRTRETVSMDTFGFMGTAQGATDSKIYFRKKSQDGAGNVADGTAEHVLISVAAGSIRVEAADASHPEPYENNVIVTPRNNGTDPTMTVSTASTIVVP